MLYYAIRRFGHAILVLWATFTAAFILLYWLPGDAVISKVIGTAGSGATIEQDLARVRADLGYDRPLAVQYLDMLASTVSGDLGRSIQTGQPVTEMFADAIPETLQLALAALVIGTIVGTLLALVIASLPSGTIQQVFTSLTALGVSIPTFWLGLLAIQLLSFHFKLLPAVGNKGLSTLILPACVLAVPAASSTAQLLSSSLRKTLREPFVTMARAKGGSWAYVLFAHAFRNSVFPVITALGVTAGTLIGGTVVMETVFSRLGIGSVIMRAVNYQDTPVVLAAVIFTAAVFVLINFIVDLCYPLIDRRVDIGVRPSRPGNRAV